MKYYIYKTNMIFKGLNNSQILPVYALSRESALELCDSFPKLKIGKRCPNKSKNYTFDATQKEKELIKSLIEQEKLFFENEVLE